MSPSPPISFGTGAKKHVFLQRCQPLSASYQNRAYSQYPAGNQQFIRVFSISHMYMVASQVFHKFVYRGINPAESLRLL
jgi:hypothetical protein